MGKKEKQLNSSAFHGKVYLLLPLLFILAFVLRYLFLMQFRETTFFHSTGMDSLYYLKWAACFRDGAPFINEAYFMGPLYPFFLSFLMRFIGNEIYALTLVQIVLGAVTVCLTAYVGTRIFNGATGLVAGIIAALYLPFIFYEGLILMVTLYTFLGLLTLFVSWQALEGGKPGLFFLSGLLLGLAALARANILAFGFFFLFWILLMERKRGIKKAFLFGLGILLMILPVTIRNYRIEGIFVPITSNAGLNFYIGNNENAKGLYVPLDHLPLTMDNDRGFSIDGFNDPTGRRFAELYTERLLTSAEVSSFWLHHGLEFIKHHPRTFLRNTLMKMVYFWNGYEIPQIESFYYIRKLVPFLKWPLLNFMLVVPLGLTGFFLLWRERRKYAVLYLFVLAYFISIIPFFVTSRYRLPVLPCLILFAAHALTILCGKLGKLNMPNRIFYGIPLAFIIFFLPYLVSGRYWYPVLLCLLPLLLFIVHFIFRVIRNLHQTASATLSLSIMTLFIAVLAVSLPLQPGNFGMAESINNFGSALVQRGMYEKAIEAFELALSYNTGDPVVHYNLGTTYARLNQLNPAEKELKKAVDINPSSYSAWLNLSNIYHIRGMHEEDKAVQQKLIRLNPKNYKAYFHMGSILRDQGDFDGALSYYRQAAALAPEESHIFSNLGTVLFRLEEYGPSEKNFRKALALQEKFEQGARKQFERGDPMAPSEEEQRHYKAALYYNLAFVSDRRGKKDDAMAYCRKAIDLRPDYTRAIQLLAELESMTAPAGHFMSE